MSKYSLLCLGDSYTIGEGVALHESFPYQLIQLLRSERFDFHASEIVAKTGWTSFELTDHLSHTILLRHYDFVTLLIGVNNQYRNLLIGEFKNDFDFLLEKAIRLANDKAQRVIVLSIPDWGATPFAEGRNREEITREIDEFNNVCEGVTLSRKAHYINITPGSKEAAINPLLVATDQLHPSAMEYKRWVEKIKDVMIVELAEG